MNESYGNNPGGRGATLPETMMAGLAFCSGVFWGPDPEQCQAMHSGERLAFLGNESPLQIYEWCRDAFRKLGTTIGEHADGDALYQALEETYVTLFISNRQGVDAPLYHSCYTGVEGAGNQPLLMGAPALGMKDRLASSGLAITADMNHPPDHLCIEIEYLYFLLQGDLSGDKVDQGFEAGTFAVDWMLPWVRTFQDRLVKVDEDGFYTLVAGLLVNLLTTFKKG